MDVNSRRLLFRIGAVGFWVGLRDLVEILEQVSDQLDPSRGDEKLSICGALPFRQTLIPVVDLRRRLGLRSDAADTVLVLNSTEGKWALSVDSVEGFHSDREMIDLPLPRLLKAPGWRCFERVGLLAGVPFLQLDLAACYAGSEL